MPRKQASFWTRVKRGDDCWLWLGGTSDGYGTLRHNGRMAKAHRVAYELTYGMIPAGQAVLHRCDNPAVLQPRAPVLGNDRRQQTTSALAAAFGVHGATISRIARGEWRKEVAA
jgi:hypothetical protein